MNNSSKKTKKRKLNSKGRRVVRRTVAGILMLTALIVAAIPEDNSGVAKAGVETEPLDYAEDSKLDRNGKIIDAAVDGKLVPPSQSDVRVSFYPLDDGSHWHLRWQYEYFVPNPAINNNEGTGVICGYNDSAQVKVLNLNNSIFTGYEYVTAGEYDDFIYNNLTGDYVLDIGPEVNGSTGTNKNDVIAYFPDDYERYKNEYDDTLKKLQKDDPTITKPTTSAERLALGLPEFHKPKNSMADEYKYRYYCDNNSDRKGTTNLTGFTLVKAYNESMGKECFNGISYETIPSGDENTTIYLVKKLDYDPNMGNQNGLDNNGFKVNGETSIIAIGNDAFKKTQNVDKIIINSFITYIGDNAFEESFISSVDFQSVTTIGNEVFKGCKYLNDVTLSEHVASIGKEAFYGCSQLKKIVIPKGVTKIGFGGFANCPILDTVDMGGNFGCNIGEYAFYDCPLLNRVVFPKDYYVAIGKGAFALTAGTGTAAKLYDFAFPEKLGEYEDKDGNRVPVYDSDGNEYACKMGDYILANRNNLSSVTMPLDFGSSSTDEMVPVRTFDKCPDLGVVYFGTYGQMYQTSNMNLEYEPKLFEDVDNASFYVYGPATSTTKHNGEYYSLPRTSTWRSKTNVSNYVPFVYYDGQYHYEVGVGDFRYELEVDDATKTAKLITCTYIGEGAMEDAPLTIPGDVAGYTIKSMQEGCLDSIKDHITVLTIADNSIEEIGDGVFEDCAALEGIDLGNSIKSIGSNTFANNEKLASVSMGQNIETIGDKAFYNCDKLENVFWKTPSSTSTLTSIGQDAFTTNSDELTFHGEIINGYKPFEYAMGDNKINSNSIRICYEQSAPYKNKCILNEKTGEVTLIDYPHYEDLDQSIRDKYENPALGNLTDDERRLLEASKYIVVPSAITSIDVLDFLDPSTTNPNKKNWIYLTDAKKKIYSDSHYSVSSDSGYFPGLFSGEIYDGDGLEAEGDDKTKYELKGNDWICSVDLQGVNSLPDYCFDSCERLQSVIIGPNCDEIGVSAFQNCSVMDQIGTNGNPKYLFDNYILYEALPNGSLKLNTCLASRGKSMTSDEIWVDPNNDPYLKDVSALQEGAFQQCKNISKVDLTDSTITAVPEKAFYGCSTLTDVKLPKTIANIAKQSFDDGAPALDVTIPANSQISDVAFDKGSTVTIWTYPECTVTKNYKPSGYSKLYVKELESLFSITFLNDDLTIYEKIEVSNGGTGYYPEKNPLPKLATHQGYDFSYWNFDNPNKIKNVTENRQALAIFEPHPTNSPKPSSSPSSSSKPSSSGDNKSPNPSGSAKPSGSPSANSAGYNVIVENGAGSGNYEAGKVVTITAYSAVTGMTFDRWTTSNTDIGFSNAYAVSTTFIMPTHNVKVTATYKTASNNSASKNSASNNSTSNNNTNNSNSSNYNSNRNSSSDNNVNSTNGPGGNTEVRVTSDAIDNNNKNLASATVAGSTDNFVVKVTDSAAASAQVEAALKAEYGDDLSSIKYVAFDISLYDSTGTYLIENSENLAVTITLPIPDELVTYAGNNKAAAVINGVLDKKDVKFTTIDGVPCMTFTATHFSPYTIYADTNNLVLGVTDSTPKTGDGISPKWFLSIGLGCMSVVLFLWQEKKKLPGQMKVTK